MKSKNRNLYESLNNVYYVTTTTVGFIKIFDNPNLIEILINNLGFYQSRGDFILLAYVIMPNHIHMILKAAYSKSISNIMANFKRMTSRQISHHLAIGRNSRLIEYFEEKARLESEECKIWKPRFDCMTILNEKMLVQKIKYIHRNPIRAGLVRESCEWKYSSAPNYKGYSNLAVIVDNEWKCLRFGG